VQKEKKLASSEGRHGADAIFLSLSFDCYTHTHEKENDEAKQFDVCVYVCACSLQFKPDGVYVLFFSLSLSRPRELTDGYPLCIKAFIILAPVQQQLNAFFSFSPFFFCALN
jgi:hypothetical protein